MEKLETVLKGMEDFSREEMLAFFRATSDFGLWHSRKVGITPRYLTVLPTYFEGIFQKAVHEAFRPFGWKKSGAVVKGMDDFSGEEMLAFFAATRRFHMWDAIRMKVATDAATPEATDVLLYFNCIFQDAVKKAVADLDNMDEAHALAVPESKTLLEVSEEAAKTSPKDEAPSEKADAPKEEAPSEKADALKEEAPSEATPTKTIDAKEPPPVKRAASGALAAPEGDAKMARVEAPSPVPFKVGA